MDIGTRSTRAEASLRTAGPTIDLAVGMAGDLSCAFSDGLLPTARDLLGLLSADAALSSTSFFRPELIVTKRE